MKEIVFALTLVGVLVSGFALFLLSPANNLVYWWLGISSLSVIWVPIVFLSVCFLCKCFSLFINFINTRILSNTFTKKIAKLLNWWFNLCDTLVHKIGVDK